MGDYYAFPMLSYRLDKCLWFTECRMVMSVIPI